MSEEKAADIKAHKKSVSAESVPKNEEVVEESLYPVQLSHLVNNALFSDVTFIVQTQRISAHRVVIETRCPQLLSPPVKGIKTPPKKKKNMIEIEIPAEIDVTSFSHLLHYAYCGYLNIKPISSGEESEANVREKEVIMLLYSSEFFSNEKNGTLDRMIWQANMYLKEKVDFKNVLSILKLSHQFQLPLIKEFAIHFAVKNFEKLLGNKESMKELGMELFQEVVAAQQAFKSGTLQSTPIAPEPSDTFMADMKKMFQDPKDTDVNFKMNETNLLGISGSVFRCHKCLIGSRSPKLADLCNQTAVPISKESKDVAIPVKVHLNALICNSQGITTDGFTALLKWIYLGEKEFGSIAGCELVPFCIDYDLPDLLKITIKNLHNSITLDSVLTILDLRYLKNAPSFFAKSMKELKPKCLEFIVQNYTQVDFTKIRSKKLHRSITPDILTAVQKYQKKGSDGTSKTGKKEKKEKKKKTKKPLQESTDSVGIPPPPPPPLDEAPHQQIESSSSTESTSSNKSWITVSPTTAKKTPSVEKETPRANTRGTFLTVRTSGYSNENSPPPPPPLSLPPSLPPASSLPPPPSTNLPPPPLSNPPSSLPPPPPSSPPPSSSPSLSTSQNHQRPLPPPPTLMAPPPLMTPPPMLVVPPKNK